MIAGNYIGTTADGLSALGNAAGVGFGSGDGIFIWDGATNTRVGTDGISADDAGERNVISGNASYGIDIQGGGTDHTIVAGNYIGTDKLGTSVLGNVEGGIILHVYPGLGGPSGTRIGTDNSGNADDRNIISGNEGAGVDLDDQSTLSVVAGNYIGIDSTGKTALPNTNTGVFIGLSSANTIGGTSPGTGNVISGNSLAGIYILGSTLNTIAGNLIGTDISGMKAVGNSVGIVNRSSTQNTIGGLSTGSRNVISGNSGDGVQISDSGSSSNVLENNFIGVDITGETALANAGNGILVEFGASNNVIGGNRTFAVQQVQVLGTTGTFQLSFNGEPTDNIPVGADASAVQFELNNLSTISGVGGFVTVTGFSNTFAGETTTTYTVDFLGTLQDEILPALDFSSTGDGGNASIISQGGFTVAGNVISGNSSVGVLITDNGTANNLVVANAIGTNASGNAAIANDTGVEIADGATGTTIGGTTVADRNIISANRFDGVDIIGGGTAGNIVEGDYIGVDADGMNADPNQRDGVDVNGASGTIIGGPDASAGNIISGNVNGGVQLENNASNNLLEGNYIGVAADGATPFFDGTPTAPSLIGFDVSIVSSNNNTLIGNVMSGTSTNLEISGAGSFQNKIENNFIGVNSTGSLNEVQSNNDIILRGTSDNIIGGVLPGQGNVIGGASTGIRFWGDGGTGNLVEGNSIGVYVDGAGHQNRVANFTGIVIINDTGDTIGGLTTTPGTGAGNIIAGNVNGIAIAGTTGSGDVIEGNLIGTADGTTGFTHVNIGVNLDGAAGNTVGGTDPQARNIITSSQFGIYFGSGSTGNNVQGNYIGTDVNGGAPLANVFGVYIDGTSGNVTANVIGGTASTRANVISGNTDGIDITGSGATSNVVQGNYIGTDVNGTAPLGNAANAVLIEAGASGNTIGGSIAPVPATSLTAATPSIAAAVPMWEYCSRTSALPTTWSQATSSVPTRPAPTPSPIKKAQRSRTAPPTTLLVVLPRLTRGISSAATRKRACSSAAPARRAMWWRGTSSA